MANYKVEISRTAEKQIASLPRVEQVRVLRAVMQLEEDAQPKGSRKLQGYEFTYRIRVGMYRIIYDLDGKRAIIVVLKVGHRKEIYR
ncbi:MAG: type II toxin-antitoxin system RelE/ParE family toxin [Polyangiaceae bacterium]|nr:type II toxin-antitoxin system RelE/ParE family toxin [Polyangiaceae bacterium]